jgi:prepilin-type N-terminal cleavage/methylation domain-containing protein
MSQPLSRVRRGFTLVELLVASAIMVMIVLVVVKVAVDTMTAYDKVVADLSAQSEGRAVLDNLERDLNTAMLRPDGRCWMEIIAPGAPGAPTGFGNKVPNVPADLQPILMFFASPADRPKFVPGSTTIPREPIRGDLCAVSYRMGLRSPFDMPGELIQQVYSIQRTLIDPQSTFQQALPHLTVPSGPLNAVTTGVPSTYWYGTARRYPNYNSPGAGWVTGQLMDGTSNGGWTMDESNFCAQNTVALSVILWCASSETKAQDFLRLGVGRPGVSIGNGLPPDALRPVTIYPASTETTFRAGNSGTTYGQQHAYWGLMPPAPHTTNVSTSTSQADKYIYRARVYADRILLDARATPLPYALRQVEVSVTVLTPEGARELRALQNATGSATFAETNQSAFRRIVAKHGRPYSRRILVLGNGG